MTTLPHTTRLSTKNKIGLVLAALLALGDVISTFIVPEPGPGEQGPPMEVLVAGGVLGVITLVAVGYAFRSAGRAAARIVAGSRILSMIMGLPAFFVDGVPALFVALAALGVVLTVLSVWLVLARRP